jgi:CHAD domain-containing protein
LVSLLRKRLRRFAALLAEVLGEQTPDAVHDLRVWSRRLQQTLAALFPASRSHRLRSLRRTLRRSRRALGAWRNCDVVLQRLARRQRQTRSSEKRRAWALVIDSVRNSRQQEVRRARKKLVRLDLFDLAEEVEALLKAPAASRDGASASPFDIVSSARADWQAALSRALEDRRVENIHGFRIQTKRLRYRIELLRDLGGQDTDAPLEWLKSLQDTLGGWHDRLELGRCIAEALATPERLHDHPRMSIILLTELEKENRLAAAELDGLMREASDSPRRTQFDAWVAIHCEAPQQQNIESVVAAEAIPAGQRVPTE